MAPVSVFCVTCGRPLSPIDSTGLLAVPPEALSSTSGVASPDPLPEYGPVPWAAWPPPPPKRKVARTAWVVAVVVVAAIVVIATVAFLVLQPRANFLGITKTGTSGSSMFFDVTIRTQGASIGEDRLHVNLQSVRGGATFDEVIYYNIGTIPAGSTFVWNVDILIDPLDEPSFTYQFTLQVNGTPVDSSTVT